LREEPKAPTVFFVLFFYHEFFVLRYKKLRAALAMERMKPGNQTKHKGNHILKSTTNSENNLPETIYQRSCMRK